MKRAGVIRTTAFAVFLGITAAMLTLFPAKTHLTRFLAWVSGMGPWGPVLLAAAYIPSTVLFVPGSILTLGAGFAFGVAAGTIAVSVGSTLGAAVAFLAGRTLARDFIESRVPNRPKFQAIDRAVGREGFKIVLLSRLSPLFPFNLLNYAFGLTGVSFREYLLASWIGMLPGTLLYVYLGSAVASLAALATGGAEGGIGQRILFLVGLAATVAVTTFMSKLARRALNESLPVTPSSEASAERLALEDRSNA